MRRFLFVITIVFIILTGAYIIKSCLGIDMNKSFSLVSKMPAEIQSLFVAQRRIVHAQEVNPILREDFRSEEHTSELQSHSFISYAVFCLKKKK